MSSVRMNEISLRMIQAKHDMYNRDVCTTGMWLLHKRLDWIILIKIINY